MHSRVTKEPDVIAEAEVAARDGTDALAGSALGLTEAETTHRVTRQRPSSNQREQKSNARTFPS